MKSKRMLHGCETGTKIIEMNQAKRFQTQATQTRNKNENEIKMMSK